MIEKQLPGYSKKDAKEEGMINQDLSVKTLHYKLNE